MVNMNDDIKKYPIFFLYNGKLLPCTWIKSTEDYNHSTHNLHHFIPKGKYKIYKKWYDEHGIGQKLIYLPEWLHKELHDMAFSDEQFEKTTHISRWDLIFNKKHSKY